MGREKLMKFKPETLLQIYLDGSFTEEAQAEFDALMRQDPAFSQKVTQAVAERLGPLPDAKIDETAAHLDGKMDAIWARYKPSPMLRSLKLTGKIALGLSAAGGLYFGAHCLWPKIQETIGGQPFAMLHLTGSRTGSDQPSGNEPMKALPSTEIPQEKKALAPLQPSPLSQTPHSQVEVSPVDGAPNSAPEGKNQPVLSIMPSGPQNGIHPAPPLAPNPPVSSSANGQNPANPATFPGSNPAPQALLSTVPAIKSGSSSGTEGDALRVSIEMPKTQNVVVTVYDGNGLLIRHLYQGVLDAGDHYIDWDSKDELGNAVLPGDYIVVLDLGNKKMSGVLKVLQNP
jgi:hypothetical protein